MVNTFFNLIAIFNLSIFNLIIVIIVVPVIIILFFFR